MTRAGPRPPYIDGMRRRLLAAGALTVLLAVTTGGCSLPGGEDDTPEQPDATDTAVDLTEPEGVRAKCVLADPDGEVILHPGSVLVTRRTKVLGARLLESANLQVIERSIVEFTGPIDLQGVVLDYPPLENAGLADALADWDTREPLLDRVLYPRDGKQAMLLAVQLIDRTRPGRLKGVQVRTRSSIGFRAIGFEQLLLVLPADDICTIEAVADTTEWTR